jgi:hypothetical protein
MQVLSFERLPIPETVDYMSEAAAEKTLARKRQEHSGHGTHRDDGINLTPEMARACDTPQVQEYLAHLAELPGKRVSPRELLPSLKRDAYFRWAYPIPNTALYLGLDDPVPPSRDKGTTEVQFYSEGPNFGSGGGPTLQLLGAIARLEYQGVLDGASQ